MNRLKSSKCLFLLILFVLSACAYNRLQDRQSEEPECIFTVLDDISEQIKERTKQLSSQDIQRFNVQFDTLSRHQIYFRQSLSFDEIYDKFQEFQALDSLFTSQYLKFDNRSYFFIYSRFRFILIVEIQKRLEKIYYHMPSMERLSYSARYIVANEDFSSLKTNILNSLINMIPNSKTASDRRQGWFSLSYMLKHIALDRLTPGTQSERRSHFGIKITKNEVFKKLESVAKNESERDIKKYALKIIEDIKNTKLDIKTVNRTKIIYEMSNPDSLLETESEESIVLFDSAYNFEGNQNKINYYNQAIELNPKFSAAYFNRGISYFETRQYGDAIKDFTMVIELNPTEYSAFLYRGYSYLKSFSYKQAIADFTECIKRDAASYQAYSNRGQSYQRMNNYRQAIIDYNNALALNPDDAVTLNNRGICFRSEKKYSNAINDHLKAVEIDPNNAASYYNLGCNYWQLNDMQSVIRVWEKCLEIDPDFPEAKENLPQARNLAKWQKRKVKRYRRVKEK